MKPLVTERGTSTIGWVRLTTVIYGMLFGEGTFFSDSTLNRMGVHSLNLTWDTP